jgi:hypothetical protein
MHVYVPWVGERRLQVPAHQLPYACFEAQPSPAFEKHTMVEALHVHACIQAQQLCV